MKKVTRHDNSDINTVYQYSKLKRTLFGYTLSNILLGCIACSFIYVFYFFSDSLFASINIQLEKQNLLLFLCCICVVIAIYFMLIPVLIFVIIYSPRGLTDLLKQASLSEIDVVKDYRFSKPMGKINAGEKCIYIKKNGVMWTVPYNSISWTYIKVLNKRVVQTQGYSRVPTENISSKKFYTLILKTIRNKTFQIPIKNLKYVKQYEMLFSAYPDILIGYTDDNRDNHKQKVIDSNKNTHNKEHL